MSRVHAGLLLTAAILLAPGCGESPRPSQQQDPAPQLQHVVIVVLENQSFDKIIGSPWMPFLNRLAREQGLAANYYANTQPSIGNYFMLVTGQIVTNDSAFDRVVDIDNLARRFAAAGVSWKVYAESLPEPGYIGGNQYPYVKRHNPFAYLSDVRQNPAEAAKMVPFAEFAADVAAQALPQYSFVVPNQWNNMHDCPGGVKECSDAAKRLNADLWLAEHLSPLLEAPWFRDEGLLVITFDEAEHGERRHGGGHIATVLAGAVKPRHQSARFYQHQNLLRTVCDIFRIEACPGAAAEAGNMGEFFE